MSLPRRPCAPRHLEGGAPRVRAGRIAAVASVLSLLVATIGCSGDEPFEPSVPRATTGPAAALNEPVTETGFTYQWQQLPIGGGGWVTGLVVAGDAGVMYARTDVGGAYRRDPNDPRWHQLLTAASTASFGGRPTDLSVESIAVAPADPQVIYLAVGDDQVVAPGEEQPEPTGRVLASTDGGRSWAASSRAFLVGGNMDHRQRSERMAVDPGNPRRAWLGTRTQGLWVTDDGGATWAPVSRDDVPAGRTGEGDETSPAGISFVTATPGDGDATRLYVGVAGQGVWRSDDSGATWRPIDRTDDPADAPFEGTVLDDRLYVAWKQTDKEGTGRLGRYDPDADRWDDITPDQDAFEWSVAVDPANTDHLLAADLAVTEGRVWRSLDGGANWDRVTFSTSSPALPWFDQKDVAGWMSIGRLVLDPSEPGRLWFAEGLGVWRADDVFGAGDLRLVNDSVGIEETVTAKVVAPPGGDPISVVADVQGFWHPDLGAYPTAPLVDGTFAGGTDVDWSGRNPRVLVWAGAEYQRYWDDDRPGRGAISRDGGRTWSPLPNLSRDQFGGNIAVSATDPDNIVWVPSYYVSSYEFDDPDLARGVFVTDDGGRSWTELDGVDGSHRFHRLMWWFARQALVSDKVDGGVFYLNDDESHFWVSTDGGRSWAAARHAPPCKEANACHVHGQLRAAPDRGGEVWASVGDDGLFRSSDRGATPWTKIAGVDEVMSFDFGAPLPGQQRPAIYLVGRVHGDEQPGLWRSGDQGATWTLIGRQPLGGLASITNVNGDLDEPGRVYVSFGGQGIAYGEDPQV